MFFIIKKWLPMRRQCYSMLVLIILNRKHKIITRNGNFYYSVIQLNTCFIGLTSRYQFSHLIGFSFIVCTNEHTIRS